MNRLLVLGVTVPLMVFASCSSNSSSSGTGGKPGGTGGASATGGTGTGGAGMGGMSASGGTPAASGGAPQGGAGGTAAGPTLAQLCGAATAMGGAGGAAGGAGGTATASLSFVNQTYVNDNRVNPSEAIFSFINTVDDPHTQVLRLHNGGTSSVEITSLQIVGNTLAPATGAPATPGAAGGTLFPQTYNQVSLPAAFKMTTTVATFPTTLVAGADIDVTIQFLSTKTNPADRFFNIGGQSVSAVLVAQTAGGCIPAGLYATSLWNNSETAPDPTANPPVLPSANWARYEPTFGQIIATLGYKVDLGADFIMALNTRNLSIPAPGLSTEEVQVRKFVKFDPAAPVELLAVGRFSPPTDVPFGWYTIGSLTGAPAAAGSGGAGGSLGAGGGAGAGGAAGAKGGAGGAAGTAGAAAGAGGGTAGITGSAGAGGAGGAAGAAVVVTDAQPPAVPMGSTQAATQPAALTGKTVATMLASPVGPMAVDWNTSNYSEMVLPPLKTGSAGITFDPATTVFGIWAYTAQRSVGGVASDGTPAPNVGNGDYMYSEDALNIPPDAAHNHRLRVYPLKNRAGVVVPHAYLLGWEEASNGDYNDYIFLLKNVSPAP